MKIKDIMVPIKKTSVDSTVTDAAKIMDVKNIGSLFIEEDGKVIGIITEGDVLRKIVAQGKDPSTTLVKDIMSSPLITIEPEKSIEEANELMAQHKIRRLPVDNNGEIVGIVSMTDISNSMRYSLGKRLIREGNYNRPGY